MRFYKIGVRQMTRPWPNKGAPANSHRALRLRVAGNLCIACALHRRCPVAVAELGSLGRIARVFLMTILRIVN